MANEISKNGIVLRYVSIYNELKSDILKGRYAPGTLIPPEPELMSRFDASRTTIRHAISLLKEDGLVNVKQGYGTEITKTLGANQVVRNMQKFKNIKDIRGYSLVPGEISSQKGAIDMILADANIAKHLDIPPNENVYRVQRVKMIEDSVFCYIASYLPCSLVPGFERFNNQVATLYECLKNEYGITITWADEHITAKASPFLESRLLNVAVGSPILVLKRQAFENQSVIEYAESFYRTDLYEFVVHMDGDIRYLDEGENGKMIDKVLTR